MGFPVLFHAFKRRSASVKCYTSQSLTKMKLSETGLIILVFYYEIKPVFIDLGIWNLYLRESACIRVFHEKIKFYI